MEINLEEAQKEFIKYTENFNTKDKNVKRESQVRSFFGQHFKKKKYVDNKNTYSTNEIVIGTYLGKPLYRKSYK